MQADKALTGHEPRDQRFPSAYVAAFLAMKGYPVRIEPTNETREGHHTPRMDFVVRLSDREKERLLDEYFAGPFSTYARHLKQMFDMLFDSKRAMMRHARGA